MPQTPHWERPEVRRIQNESAREEIRAFLAQHELAHLDVRFRGSQLVIYQTDEGEQIPRIRFSRIGNRVYQLDVARHTGHWEMTPYNGSLADLIAVVTQQFSWLLTEI